MIDIILIGHFFVGLITAICIITHDMRGEEFDPNFFEVEVVFATAIVISGGYLAPLILWIACLSSESRVRKHRITKLIHKLSNIGFKKDSK